MRCHPFSVRHLFTTSMRSTIISHFTKSLSFLALTFFLILFFLAFLSICTDIQIMSTSKPETTDHLSWVKMFVFQLVSFVVVATPSFHMVVCSFRSHLIHFILSAFITISSLDVSLILLVSLSFLVYAHCSLCWHCIF